MEIYRGDIFFVKKGGYSTGSEQEDGRPAVVVSNDKANEHSPVVEVVYLTTQPKKSLPTHVEVLCRVPSVALCEQIHSVFVDRLSDYVKTCTDEEMEAIDRGLMISLGLNEQPKEQAVETSGMIDDLKMKLEVAERMLDQEKTFVDRLQYDLGKLADERDALVRKLEDALEELTDKATLTEYEPADAVVLATQRDMYKQQYEMLLDRLIG